MKKAASLLALFCIAAFAQQKGTFTDTRDGKTYKTTKIGEQVWMAENLNYGADGKCYKDRNYPNEAVNCKKYGRLYFWKEAKTVCPKGWHLPASKEWEALFSSMGGKKTLDEKTFKIYEGMEKLKAKDGFAALLSGRFYIDYNEGETDVNYVSMGYSYCWFSASPGDFDGELWWHHVENGIDKMKLRFINEVTEGCSVRCVRD
jgi:uncharacterized protein (TIGR02145 family)